MRSPAVRLCTELGTCKLFVRPLLTELLHNQRQRLAGVGASCPVTERFSMSRNIEGDSAGAEAARPIEVPSCVRLGAFEAFSVYDTNRMLSGFRWRTEVTKC